MEKRDENIARSIRLHSLLSYIILAMQVGDIGMLDHYNKMWPVIKKDLRQLPRLVWPDIGYEMPKVQKKSSGKR